MDTFIHSRPAVAETIYTIDLLKDRPRGFRYMPNHPPNETGTIAFPPELDEEWLTYLSANPNRLLLDADKHLQYLNFLSAPSFLATPTNNIKHSKNQLMGIKYRATTQFELQNGCHIYRKAEKKGIRTPGGAVGDREYRIRYAARTCDAFRIIANTHSMYEHPGIRKTHEIVSENYYGITEANVKWVLEQCGICALNAKNKTKAIITPIASSGCLDRIQIDLMDFRAKADGDYKWIIQIKDHFSHFVWLHPLKGKESEPIAEIMNNWFMYCGYPKIL